MVKRARQLANLTPRQSRFVEEFLVDLNGAAAAERAGYTGSMEALAVTASRLRRKPGVKEALAAAQEKRAARVEQRLTSTRLNADRVLEEVAHIAFVDPATLMGDGGALLDLKDMPEATRRAVASVKVRKDDTGATVTEVRFWDKTKANELAMRHLGLLRDKVEVTGEGGAALVVEVVSYKGRAE